MEPAISDDVDIEFIYARDGKWYFKDPEGKEHGTFHSEFDAMKGMSRYIKEELKVDFSEVA